jgi:hypothetical protein
MQDPAHKLEALETPNKSAKQSRRIGDKPIVSWQEKSVRTLEADI